jgi:membrane fusion protein, multidrug efflux system
MTHPFNKILSATMVVSICFCLCSCGSSAGDIKKEKSAASSPAAIPVVTPAEGRLISSIRIPGELQAYQQVDLYAKVNSFVNKITVDVGTEVKAGQVLAILDAPELKSQQNAASSRLQSQQALYLASKATYERLLQTSKTPGTISPNDLEQANARQQADLAQLEAAKANVHEISDTREYLQIRAPFSGIITARNVSAGAYVGPSGKGSELPIFTLVEQKKLRLVVSVPEAYSASLNKAGEVRFTVSSLAKDTLTAKISRAAGALDNRLRSQRIEMDVVNNDGTLLPGMIAEIIIPLQSNEKAITVPASAILNSTLGVFVIRIENKKAHWVPVTTGISSNGMVEVTGELSATDTIVKQATEEIRDGAVVN